MALNTIVNYSRPSKPRNKVYGRKRHIPLELNDANRRLFGADDENSLEIGKKLSKLSLSNEPACVKGDHDSGKEDDDQVPLSRPAIAHAQPYQCEESEEVNQNAIEAAASATTKASSPVNHRHATLQAEKGALRPVLRLPLVKSTVRSFPNYGARLTKNFDVSKLNEGSYSDCFVIRKPGKSDEVAVLKVIPFDCSADKASNSATYAHDFLREVKLLSALEQYHGFAQIFEAQVVRGRMHDALLQAARVWLDHTTEDTDKTINPASRYPEKQISGVIEMAYAGQDLELMKNPSAFQAFDAFWMAVILIGKAETEIEFEHRDLHMSNICFRAGPDGNIDAKAEFISSLRKAPAEILGLSGLEITIIDYTHSRMKDSSAEIFFNPECPFTADDMQYFRENCQPCDQMDTVLKAERWVSECFQTQEDDHPKYYAFTPKTNVIWLSHVLNQLTLHSQRSRKHTCVAGSSATAKKLQASIWKTLLEVLKWIGSADLNTLPSGAASFLDEAIDRGFITREEVNAFMRRLNTNSSP